MLSDAHCRNAKPKLKLYRLNDHRGLYLEVKPSGVKAWRFRFTLRGKASMFALGDYPIIGLAEARERSEAARSLVRQGINPAQQRQVDRTAISHAAKKLRFAMDMLSEEELDSFGSTQKSAFLAHVEKLNDADRYDLHSYYDGCDEPFSPRAVSKMKEWRDLYWIEQAANFLIAPRERGRPKSVAEHWAAERFVILCHRHKWSPVKLSNSGSERQGSANAVPSPAVVCLAAVFRAGGGAVGREIVQATSALKALRDSPLRTVEWPQSGDPEIEFGAEFYKVSLQNVEFSWPGVVGALPNFVPKGK